MVICLQYSPTPDLSMIIYSHPLHLSFDSSFTNFHRQALFLGIGTPLSRLQSSLGLAEFDTEAVVGVSTTLKSTSIFLTCYRQQLSIHSLINCPRDSTKVRTSIARLMRFVRRDSCRRCQSCRFWLLNFVAGASCFVSSATIDSACRRVYCSTTASCSYIAGLLRACLPLNCQKQSDAPLGYRYCCWLSQRLTLSCSIDETPLDFSLSISGSS